MKKWVQITRGVRINGKHRDPSEPPFEVDEKFAAYLKSAGKARIVDPPPDPISQRPLMGEAGGTAGADAAKGNLKSEGPVGPKDPRVGKGES